MPKILIVEDNEMNRDMLSRRLRRRGFDVGVAADGRQGVEMALRGGHDLILMDMSLPELDGWEATRLIRESSDVRSTPIIALTAHAMAGDRQRALDAGCDDYDTKPVEFSRLLGKIENLLGGHRGASSRRPSSDPENHPDPIGRQLRTPLSLIIGYAESMLEGVAAEPRPILEDVLGEARAVLKVVDTSNFGAGPGGSGATARALTEDMDGPLERIRGTTSALLAEYDPEREKQLVDDLGRVRSGLERLLSRRLATHSVTDGATPLRDADEGVGSKEAVEPARILVVDDIEDNRRVLERRLTRLGHHVTCASGGAEALERVSDGRFDIVLLDVMMPDIDGLTVLEQLKASPEARDIPVLMITALDDEATVVKCIERGAEDHLAKPFDPVLLRARIDACLEKKRLRDVELEYLKQVNLVISAASAVESGIYDDLESLSAVAERDDELGRLARVFRSMAAEVQAREDRLSNQVDALRQEIVRAQRAGGRAAPPTAKHALPKGSLFADRYEIIDEIGSGCGGIVYLALDRQLGEKVAIKTLHPNRVSDEAVVERFRSEIRLARNISHANVVRVYDIGNADGIYYLTMEYVEGITVRGLLNASGSLSVPATMAIAEQLTQSLVTAHDRGVVHRDIKPENLLLDGEGVLKIMDFGLARLAESDTSMTMDGGVVGTPAYMAPEQLLSEHVDGRTDLYSTGVVLYECLTGRLPLQAETYWALVARVIREEPESPLVRNASIPRPLGDLILTLLAKDPDQRPASAAELAKLLADIR